MLTKLSYHSEFTIRHKVEKITSILSYIDALCVYSNRFVLNEKQQWRVSSLRERKEKTDQVRVRQSERWRRITWQNMGWIKRNTPRALGSLQHFSMRRKGIRFIIIHRMWNGFWWWSCTFAPLFNFQFEIDTFSYSMCNGFIFGALIVYVILNGTGNILKWTVSFVHCIHWHLQSHWAGKTKKWFTWIYIFHSEKKLPLSLSLWRSYAQKTHTPQ